MKAKSSHIDPVCRMRVRSMEAAITAVFNGRTYYFCAPACQNQFMAEPQKYLRDGKPKRKGFWQRYLERLNKSTGGKPPSCCH